MTEYTDLQIRHPSRALRFGASLVLLITVGLGSWPGALEGQGDTPRPARIKAAFLYNFSRFVEWPEASSTGVDICFLGDPTNSVSLGSIAGKLARGRPVRVADYQLLDDVVGCEIVFVGGEWEARLSEVFRTVEETGVLTVGDAEGFAEKGGMIGLKLRRNRYLLEINLSSIQAAGLRVSSQLLNLADIIEDASDSSGRDQ